MKHALKWCLVACGLTLLHACHYDSSRSDQSGPLTSRRSAEDITRVQKDDLVIIDQIVARSKRASCQRGWVIFTDYDGTLVGEGNPDEPTEPDPALISTLNAAAASGEVHIVSARKRFNMMRMFIPGFADRMDDQTRPTLESPDRLTIGLHASYGLWSRAINAELWRYNSVILSAQEESAWKTLLKAHIQDTLTSRFSYVLSEKEGALRWTLTTSEEAVELAKAIEAQLDNVQFGGRALSSLLMVQALATQVDVRLQDINKSVPIRDWVKRQGRSAFLIAIGDGPPDEVMFDYVQSLGGVGVRVGHAQQPLSPTKAQFVLKGPSSVRFLLNRLSGV